jgi:hypothetical protein
MYICFLFRNFPHKQLDKKRENLISILEIKKNDANLQPKEGTINLLSVHLLYKLVNHQDFVMFVIKNIKNILYMSISYNIKEKSMTQNQTNIFTSSVVNINKKIINNKK